jgi:hypothetical protein
MYIRIFSRARISGPRYLCIETIYWMFFKSASQIFFVALMASPRLPLEDRLEVGNEKRVDS